MGKYINNYWNLSNCHCCNSGNGNSFYLFNLGLDNATVIQQGDCSLNWVVAFFIYLQLEHSFAIIGYEEGTSVLKTIKRSMQYNQVLDMIYLDSDGAITKRRVKTLKVTEDSFQAYCYLRGSRRIFKVDNVLALVPITISEGMAI